MILLSSSLVLLCTYHWKLMQSNAILPQLLFQLALLYPLSLLLTPSSDDTTLPELTWICLSWSLDFLQMQLSHSYASGPDWQAPLLWEVQKTSLKAETTQRPGQSILCQIQSLTRDAIGHPKIANFTFSPSGRFKSTKKWQIECGLYPTYFTWCLLRRGAVHSSNSCVFHKQFRN